MDSNEYDAIQQQIRDIDQEMAGSEKRFQRFKQAADALREKNRKNLDSLGVSSMEELEQLILGQPLNAEGVRLFTNALKEKGIALPEFLKRVKTTAETNGENSHSTDERALPLKDAARTPIKKKKRIKFRL